MGRTAPALEILTAAPVKITNLTKKESTVHLACCSVLFNARTLGHTTLSMIVASNNNKGRLRSCYHIFAQALSEIELHGLKSTRHRIW